MATSQTKALIVRKSNALARARWSPDSVWEPRIVAILASKINPNDTDFQIYNIYISEIIGKNPGGKDYKDIENIIDKAMSRIITIRNNDNWKKYTLFSSCEFISKNGLLKIGIHPELKEHFLQLKQYIKYNLTEFMLLPSIYSQRLFEILKSWNDKNEIILDISELHEILDVPKALKEKYKDFRVRVLDKAHKDINEQTELKYSWEPIKTGRAVTAIKFTFTKEIPTRRTNYAPRLPQNTPNTSNTYQSSNSYSIFKSFFKKFPNNDNTILMIQAHKLWMSLNQSGKAPLASDVPDNNKLEVIQFIEQWENSKK